MEHPQAIVTQSSVFSKVEEKARGSLNLCLLHISLDIFQKAFKDT